MIPSMIKMDKPQERGMERMGIRNDAGGISDDIYSIIRSPEVRDYYRRGDVLGIFEKEQLILHSYTSIQRKAALLEELAKTGNEKERRKSSEMCRVFHSYLDRIYNPKLRTVFLMESGQLVWDEEAGSIDRNGYGLDGAFDTIDELIAEMTGRYVGCEEEYYADVSVLEVPQDGKVAISFEFSLFWIDGKWEIKDLCIEKYGDRGLRAQGLHKDTADRFDNFGGHHPLPFENRCRLKLQLPFMKEPVYGELDSTIDGIGCWYHFFYSDCVRQRDPWDYVDLTWWEINLTSSYSSLDWIERA